MLFCEWFLTTKVNILLLNWKSQPEKLQNKSEEVQSSDISYNPLVPRGNQTDQIVILRIESGQEFGLIHMYSPILTMTLHRNLR